MAVKNRHTDKKRRLLDVINEYFKVYLKQFEFRKTFEWFRVGKWRFSAI